MPAVPSLVGDLRLPAPEEQRRHARDDRQRRSAIANVFSTFSGMFSSFHRFGDVFGPVRTYSDAFGCVQMRSDAFGSVWTVLGNFDFLFGCLPICSTSSSVFERFRLIWDAGRVCAIYRRSPRALKISKMCALKPFSCWLLL